MDKVIFLVFSSIGLFVWMILGYRLIKNGNSTRKQFAGLNSMIFSILIAILSFISTEEPSVLFSLLLFSITFITGFTFSYIAFPKLQDYILN